MTAISQRCDLARERGPVARIAPYGTTDAGYGLCTTTAGQRRRPHITTLLHAAITFLIGVMHESFGSSLGGRSRRARDADDDELDLHGYTTGTHEPRKRPIRTNADSHTEPVNSALPLIATPINDR